MRFGPKHAKGQKKKRGLERKVLVHLKKYGTSLYDALSVRFDPDQTGEVQPILRRLKEYGYIDVSADKMVTITSFGLLQLESTRLTPPAPSTAHCVPSNNRAEGLSAP